MTHLSQEDRNRLRQQIDRYFNLGDLRVLCFDLGIEYEDLAGDTKAHKVVSLIEYCWRRDLIPDLLAAVGQARPTVDWPIDQLAGTRRRLPSSEPDQVEPQRPSGQATGDRQTEESPPPEEPTQPLGVLLILNIIFVAALTIALDLKRYVPCVSTLPSSLSLAITLMGITHLVWRILKPSIRSIEGTLNAKNVKIPLKQIIALIDLAHPQKLSGYLVGGGAMLLILTTSWLHISQLSPIQVPEPAPLVQSFSVSYPSTGTTATLFPGDLLELANGEQVQIRAIFLNQDATSMETCHWLATNGNPQPAQVCNILYSIRSTAERDTLVVRTETLCKANQALAGLHVALR